MQITLRVISGEGENEEENVQGTNSEGKETWTQINNLEQKEEIIIQPEHNKETRIQKKEKLRNFQDIFKHPNIEIIGMPGEEEEQKLKTYLNK